MRESIVVLNWHIFLNSYFYYIVKQKSIYLLVQLRDLWGKTKPHMLFLFMVLELVDSYIVLIMSSFITSSPDPNFNHTPTHPTHHITLTLTRDNGKLLYLWRKKKFGFIDATISIPSNMFHTNPTHIPMSNLAYDFWYQQDQLILITLLCSLSEPILTNINGLETSRDVWLTLEKMFSTSS